MLPPIHNRIQSDVANALEAVGFRSWVGGRQDSATWMVKKFGDVYLHETVISHIRRFLDGEFVHNKLHETPDQFRGRMKQVENYMNSNAFKAWGGGEGLMGLAKELRNRCKALVASGGERLPK